MSLLEWEMKEDNYQEQLRIPKEIRELAKKDGISTENKQKVTVLITNLSTGESYTGRLAITGHQEIYVPVSIQKMLVKSKKFRVQILGG